MVERITDKLVKSLCAPSKGAVITYDDEIKGLGIRITKNGIKAFVLNYTFNRRERRYTIGKYPEWSVVAARERAKELRRNLDVGQDPQTQRDEAKAAQSLKDLYADYAQMHLPRLGAYNRKDIEAMWRQDILPSLGAIKLKDLTGKHIDNLHKKISVRAPVRANRVIANLRSVLNLGIRWGVLDKNPALGFQRNTEQPKNTYLSHAEILSVFDCLSRMRNKQAANIIRLLIFTGARLGEVLSSEWKDYDLDKGIWVKPPSKTKQRRVHAAPLSVEAIILLNGIKSELVDAGGDAKGLVFVSKTGKSIRDIKRPWAWLLLEAKLENIRIHDLRHTYASVLISMGESLPVVGRLLGHSQPATTARYAHLMDDPLRRATQKVSAITIAVGEGS